MFWFICAIILFVIALLIFGFAGNVQITEVNTDRGSQNYGRKEARVVSFRKVALLPLFLGIFLLVLSMITVVGTRNVGVVTTFNKVTGRTLDAGLHLKAPWNSVTDIDGTIQPEEYRGDDCISVKIGDGGTACITLSYRWSINPDQADLAFQNYRNSDLEINDAIRKALVTTNVKAAINEELGEYDPLDGAELRPGMTAEELANAKINIVPDYQDFNQKIQANVEDKIADLDDLINIQSVTMSYIQLPEATEKRINAFNASVQDTKIALQKVATQKAQADGNRELAKSLQDPNVLVSKCLDLLESGTFSAPAGFSCWPGGGNSVVIPATK